MDGVINMTSAAQLTTWSDLEAARDAVAEGEIFAKGVSTDTNYEVRLRRHGKDAIAEVRLLGEPHDAWAPVDTDPDEVTGALGVISLRDIDTEVDYFPAR